MFSNVYYQEASNVLVSNIKQNALPAALLFCGENYTGRLSAAIELGRILSCEGNEKGKDDCSCPSCQKYKSFLSQNLLLTGYRDCTLEIAAMQKAFLQAVANSADSITLSALENHYIVSIRKLTARFDSALWNNDDKYNKIIPLLTEIEDTIEDIKAIVPSRDLNIDKLNKLCTSIFKSCDKLEGTFLPTSIPISQIRNISEWAHLSSISGKKIVIIEKADNMQEGARNALLKTLEEPPDNVYFVLITNRRGAILPTILSRVRTYNFTSRNPAQEKEILQTVFKDYNNNSIAECLYNFLPISKESINEYALKFLKEEISSAELCKCCNSFEPRIVLRLFFETLMQLLRPLMANSIGTSAMGNIYSAIMSTYQNITIYNQSIESALNELSRTCKIENRKHGNIFQMLF